MKPSYKMCASFTHNTNVDITFSLFIPSFLFFLILPSSPSNDFFLFSFFATLFSHIYLLYIIFSLFLPPFSFVSNSFYKKVPTLVKYSTEYKVSLNTLVKYSIEYKMRSITYSDLTFKIKIAITLPVGRGG